MNPPTSPRVRTLLLAAGMIALLLPMSGTLAASPPASSPPGRGATDLVPPTNETASTTSADAWVDAAPRDPTAEPATTTILIAGDIATCTGNGDRRTAKLIEGIDGIVMTAGDNAYPAGSIKQYQECYGPTWGRFKERTRPALGNHDYGLGAPNGYFAYFGRRAGPAGRGWYAFDAGAWRIYVLDSMRCYLGAGSAPGVSGCGPDSTQYQWLKNDLATRPHACVMGVWHHPRFSSGPHGNSSKPQPLLKLLYDHGAEIVVNGHDHVYERFAPARPTGVPDDATGITQFVVGTGGGGLYGLRDRVAPNSVVRDNGSYGVLRLRLAADGYDWQFLRVDGKPGDSGSAACHPPHA